MAYLQTLLAIPYEYPEKSYDKIISAYPQNGYARIHHLQAIKRLRIYRPLILGVVKRLNPE